MNKNFHTSIRKIIEARDQNKLVIFVGAGVSMNSGIPSWNNLIGMMKNDVNIHDENDFVKIAELYYRQRGNNEYITKVREILKYKRAKYTELHKLIFDLKPLHIITTNYDDLLEQYVSENSLPYQVIKQDTDLPYTNGNNYIIKMHGDLDIGNIVLKENDYLNYSINFPLIESYIKSLFASKLILFIGFSYSDWNLKFITQKVLNKLGDNIQPSYLMELSSSDVSTQIQADYLRSYGVSLLNYDNEIKSVGNSLSGDRGKRLFNFLSYIKSYNTFEVDTRGLGLLEKLEKGFLKYSDFNILVPNKITEILKSVGVRSSIDHRNPHCLIINSKEVKEFILNRREDWGKSKNLIDKITLIETSLGKPLSQIEKDIVTKVWEKILLSGIYFISYENINSTTSYVSIFEKSFFKDEELDLYYQCNFIEVEKKINYFKNSFDIDEIIIAAFLSYKTENYLQAYNLLNKASSLAWQTGKYLKYYLCKYNIDQIKFHFKYPSQTSKTEIYKKILDDVNQIDINEIYYTLPLKDRQIVKFLITDFIRYDFKNIDFNITKSLTGDKRFFENYHFISNKVFQIWNFINYNYLFGEHFDEHRIFYRNSFNEFLRSHKDSTGELRRVDIVIAAHNLVNDEILQILQRNKIVSLNIDEIDLNDLKRDFYNLVDSFSRIVRGDDFENISGYSKLIIKLINNYLQIFSFISFKDNTHEEIIDNLFTNIFNKTNYHRDAVNSSSNLHALSKFIGLFMINQTSFGKKFTEATLNKILDSSIDSSHFYEKDLIKYIGHLLIEQNPNYKVPFEYYENSIVYNFSTGRDLDVLISLQPILKNDYSQLIRQNISKALNDRFDLILFEIGIKGNYLKFDDYKEMLYKHIFEIVETNDDFFNSRDAEAFFATLIVQNGINVSEDQALRGILESSPFLKFWLDLNNFDFDLFQINWVLYYNDILFENHKKSKRIYEVAERIKNTLQNWDDTKHIANIYFSYFEVLN